MIKSVCFYCIREDCMWRAPSNSPLPPVIDCPGYKRIPISNADRIRSMTDEELALQLYLLRLYALHLEGFDGQIETKEEVLEWLKEEWTQDLEEVDT